MKTKFLFTLAIMTGVMFGQYNPDNHVVTISMYYMNNMDEVEDGSWTKMGELMEEEFEIEGIRKIKFPADLKLSPIEMGLVEEIFDMSVFEEEEDDE